MRELHKLHALMRSMQKYLATRILDLHALHLFHLLVKHHSFTKAAREAGLSQSAFTRQMQALESRLGVELITRTTRSVEVTAAGQFLASEAARLIGGVTATLDELHTAFGNSQPEVRVSVSRTLAMAHIPGLFHANRRRHPEVMCRVSYHSGISILDALDAHETDVGVLCLPPKLPDSVKITHRFMDPFVLLAPAALIAPKRRDRLKTWLQQQRWIMIDGASITGQLLRRWMTCRSLTVSTTMELDSFDLIINLVASGYGVSFVPRRALALYRRRESLAILPLPELFEREIVVLTRNRKLPQHVAEFVQNILF